MMKTRYQIGDVAWRAAFDSTDNYVTCPDCGGTGQITVIMHDETQHSVECQNCSRGYEPPTGRIKVYDRRPLASLVTIAGMEIGAEGVRYRTTVSHIIDNDELFDTEAEALERAKELAAEFDKAEREKIQKKEKDTRSWAWNASYHRQCIRRAEKEIEYHTAKLNVAKVKAKEPA